ncbi:MAG: SDR family oxidoreductase [Nitriliruptoraceae bacterium]
MARVLITGAGGKTGRAVIDALRERDVPVRALVRCPERHADLAGDDLELVAGDQRDVATLEGAMDGCDAVYAIAPNVSPDELAMGTALLEAASRAGLERVVYHSVIHPQLTAMPHHADKGRVEERVIESGLAWTILQPNAYLQNLAGYHDQLRAGRYEVPYATDRASAMVDLRDVAEVAARCLVERLGVHATFELSGPAAVTPQQVAAVASHHLNVEVVASRLDPDDWAAANDHLPAETRRRLHAMFAHYDRHGSPGEPTVLRLLLGREPRGLDALLTELLGA